MPRTMTVTLLNDGGKYVAVDLKHIAKDESCRMDKAATIVRTPILVGSMGTFSLGDVPYVNFLLRL